APQHCRRPNSDHVRGHRGRGRAGEGRRRPWLASLHPGADEHGPRSRAGGPAEAHRGDTGLAARPALPTRRLPISGALPLEDGHLQGGPAGGGTSAPVRQVLVGQRTLRRNGDGIMSASGPPSSNGQPKVLLEVDKLTRVFGRGPGAVTAVNAATFAVPERHIVAIVGESGSGKLTMA